MNGETDVSAAQQRLVELESLGRDLVEVLEQIVHRFATSDLDIEIEKAKTLIDRAKDTLPPNERQGYTTSEEALGRVIEHLSQQTNSDTSDKATRVAIDWQSRTIRFGRADYEISMDMISTETNALEWIRHLCGKSWMDMDLMREFVETVAICPPLSRFRSSITGPN